MRMCWAGAEGGVLWVPNGPTILRWKPVSSQVPREPQAGELLASNSRRVAPSDTM